MSGNNSQHTEGVKPAFGAPVLKRQLRLFSASEVNSLKNQDLTTKERLQLAALELFAIRGVAATTVRDIAKAAGIAEGSLYRHYTGKQDLAATLYQELASQIQYDLRDIRHDAADLESFLSNLIVYLCDLYDQQPLCYHYIFLTPRLTLQQEKANNSRENSGGDRELSLPETEITEALSEYFDWVASSFPEKPKRSAALVTAQLFGTVHHAARWCDHGLLEVPLASHTEGLLLAALRLVQE